MGIVDKLKELSYLTYGKDKSLIEEEIALKYKKEAPRPDPVAPNPFV